MIWYRLTQDHEGLLEGSTISEEKYKGIGYLSKCYFEPIEEYQLQDMIEYEDSIFCIENGIDRILFYNEHEQYVFLNKTNDRAIS
jgi:hypothetical protein